MDTARSAGGLGSATSQDAWWPDLAIETALMLGMVFGLRLPQSEGLLRSVLDMMGLELPVPDHTKLS